MSKFQTLRAFVNQRLTLAAEEIFELFERTIAENEKALCRQQKLLDAVWKPEVRLHRTDIQQLLVSKDEVLPRHHDWSPLLDKEEQPELPHIKEEQEELQRSQEGEQLKGLEEADITKITSTPVPVKSEEDEEKPQSSRLHQRQTDQMETEADGEDCGGPEPARKSNPDSHLQPAPYDKKSYPSEPETDDSCDWEETRKPQSGSHPLQDIEDHVSDMECNTGRTSVISSECATNKRHQHKHNGEKDGKRFSCSVCKKTFSFKVNLVRHMRIHTGEKPFSCSVCGKRFSYSGPLTTHLRIHTGEKPFTCSVCERSFSVRDNMLQHMRIHTGEKPFTCSVCGMKCRRKDQLRHHMRTHTGEKPFCCSVCGLRFSLKHALSKHSRIHTGEKPFSCSVCGKSFSRRDYLNSHIRIHTGEKLFSCCICQKSYKFKGSLTEHMKTHTGQNQFSSV